MTDCDPPGTARPRWRAALIAAAALGIGLALLSVAFDLSSVRSDTMAPTLHAGDRALSEPLKDDLRHGDVVQFIAPWPEAEGYGPLTFRVLGLAGDVIACCTQGALSRNGEAIAGEPVAEPGAPAARRFEIRVSPGRVFLAGDARSLANDSRAHLDLDDGTVPLAALTRRKVGTIWPLWHWGQTDGRWGGFAGTSSRSERGPDPAFLAGSVLSFGGGVALIWLALRAGISVVQRRSGR